MNKQNTSQRNFDDSYTPELESIKVAFVSQKQRAYACGIRGLATPELRQYWESEFDRAIAAHDTELREQIAQEILDGRPPATTEPSLREYITGLRSGHVMAAYIARGKAQEQ